MVGDFRKLSLCWFSVDIKCRQVTAMQEIHRARVRLLQASHFLYEASKTRKARILLCIPGIYVIPEIMVARKPRHLVTSVCANWLNKCVLGLKKYDSSKLPATTAYAMRSLTTQAQTGMCTAVLRGSRQYVARPLGSLWCPEPLCGSA